MVEGNFATAFIKALVASSPIDVIGPLVVLVFLLFFFVSKLVKV